MIIDIGLSFFAFMVAGFVLGCTVVFCGIKLDALKKYRNEKKKTKNSEDNNPKKKKKHRFSFEKLKTKLPKNKEKSHKYVKPNAPDKTGADLLDRKLKKDEANMFEFNCAADGVDASEKVREMRTHEDDAYNVLRNKKKNKS